MQDFSILLQNTIENIKSSVPAKVDAYPSGQQTTSDDCGQKTVAVCAQLTRLLKNSDTAALDLFKDNQLFLSELFPNTISLLTFHIENFDFDAAHNLLAQNCREVLARKIGDENES